jgi:hypothetical protein
MLALAQPVVAARHGVSSAVAARYFEQMAALAGKRTRASIAAPLPEEQVQASLTATGLVGTVVALSRGASLQAAAQTGFVRFSGGLSRLVLLGGRETVVSSAARSRVQWERETGGDACEFCQMLADRGPVYSEESADFPAHDHCECSAVPLF